MQKQSENKGWTIEIGLYPGVLLGIRSYKQEDRSIHVLYLPFVDIAFYIYK